MAGVVHGRAAAFRCSSRVVDRRRGDAGMWDKRLKRLLLLALIGLAVHQGYAKLMAPKTNLEAAHRALDQLQPELALVHFKEAQREHPDNLEIEIGLAQAYDQMGYKREALAHYQNARTLIEDPEHIRSLSVARRRLRELEREDP